MTVSGEKAATTASELGVPNGNMVKRLAKIFLRHGFDKISQVHANLPKKD